MPRERTKRSAEKPAAAGKLRIGDDWNAITIIALSQQNPLKAVAELVENAIDAGARCVTVTRGKDHSEHDLMVADDGAGVRRDEAGLPDFRYVATHVCDSVKRRLKAEGVSGIQGEFGIGLLSFWRLSRSKLRYNVTSQLGRFSEQRSNDLRAEQFQQHLKETLPRPEDYATLREIFKDPNWIEDKPLPKDLWGYQENIRKATTGK